MVAQVGVNAIGEMFQTILGRGVAWLGEQDVWSFEWTRRKQDGFAFQIMSSERLRCPPESGTIGNLMDDLFSRVVESFPFQKWNSHDKSWENGARAQPAIRRIDEALKPDILSSVCLETECIHVYQTSILPIC